MPQQPSIDDTNSTLISYNGDWEYLEGSTRQWQGGVHITRQAGATASFSFRGYQVWVWGTIPAGSGSNIIDVTVDGQTTSVSRQSNMSATYNEIYYTSTILPYSFHTIIVTNRGSPDNGHTEFQLDRFEFVTDDEIPLFTPPTGSKSSSIPGVPTSTPSTSVDQHPSILSNSGTTAKKIPLGGIIGGIIGGIVVIGAICLYLFLKLRARRKSNPQTTVTSSASEARSTTLLATPFPLPSDDRSAWMSSRPVKGSAVPTEREISQFQSTSSLNSPPQVRSSATAATSSLSGRLSFGSLPSNHERPPPAYHASASATQ